MSNFRRHGDVNLHPVSSELKKQVQKEGKILYTGKSFVMAIGEVTGSQHILEVQGKKDLIVREFNGQVFYEVLSSGTATHTHDHEPIVVEPDFYVQVPEREVDHFANGVIRKVVD